MSAKNKVNEISQSEIDARRLAARILGKIGGMSGRGASKRRSPEVYKAAANKRWALYRQMKAGTNIINLNSDSLSHSVRSEISNSDRSIQLAQKILKKYGFPEFRPSAELMNELKKADSSKKSGVYVHVFKGGKSFYIGISLDIRKRYLTHLKNFPDIQLSTILAVPADKQFALEFDLIGKFIRKGLNLRNILRPDFSYSEDDVEMIVKELNQYECVSNPDTFYRGKQLLNDKAFERSLDSNHPLVRKFELMKCHPAFSKDFFQVLARYIRTCMPLPALTERTLWTASCMNKGLYPKPDEKLVAMLRINVKSEVFSAVIDGDSKIFNYNFYVAAEPISPGELARLKSIPDLGYQTNTQESINLPLHQFFPYTHEAAMKLLDSEEFRTAAKYHNLMLMRKWGQTTVRRANSHNLPLTKVLFSQKVDL
jgi:hypothetical protein